MFLRDGLLRLCNKHLAGLHDAVKEIRRDAGIGKLIDLLEPSAKQREAFLLSAKLDLALLSEKPKLCELVRDLVRMTPSEQRKELFQLLVTAPKLLECVEKLSSSTKPADIVAAIPDLVRPLTYSDPPASLAQIITSYYDGGNREIARLLYDNRAMFSQTLSSAEAHNIGHKLLFVLNVKVHEGAKGSHVAAITSQVGASVRDHKLANAEAYLDSLIGEHPFVTPTPSVEVVANQALNNDTIEARRPDDKRGWASWASDLATSPEAKVALDHDMERFGDTAWFKQILLTPSSLSEYISSLNAQDFDQHQSILARNRSAEPQGSEPQTKHSTLADFNKVIFIGGLQDNSREAKLRELMPASCDVSFYYADASASSFRNMTALSLASEGKALAVYLPNFTSHSMYYKACDLAEGAGAKLLVLPKGAQNPRVIVERLREMLA